MSSPQGRLYWTARCSRCIMLTLLSFQTPSTALDLAVSARICSAPKDRAPRQRLSSNRGRSCGQWVSASASRLVRAAAQ